MVRKYRSDDWVWIGEGRESLWDFLLRKGLSRHAIETAWKEKYLLLDGKRATPRDYIDKGQEVRIQLAKEKIDYSPVPMDIEILYEDEDLLILNKPVGITVNSVGQVSIAQGIAHYFLEQGIKRKVRFLNRLDRDTSGCLVVAKSAIAQAIYQEQGEQNESQKYYDAIVDGQLEGSGCLDLPIKKEEASFRYTVALGGKMTRTEYEGLEYDSKSNTTLVRIHLVTGKTHQIRVAMSYLGHPLQGDRLYGGTSRNGETFSLHAHSFSFIHGRTGEHIQCVAPHPRRT